MGSDGGEDKADVARVLEATDTASRTLGVNVAAARSVDVREAAARSLDVREAATRPILAKVATARPPVAGVVSSRVPEDSGEFSRSTSSVESGNLLGTPRKDYFSQIWYTQQTHTYVTGAQ
jgi:hypothetical protein